MCRGVRRRGRVLLFSRADAVCERGVTRTMGRPGSSGWGWYQRAERAKFRRVVVDAKGQRGIWFVDLMGDGREEESRQEEKGNTFMEIITTTSGGVLPCTSSSPPILALCTAQAQMRRGFWKMVRCSSFAGCPHPANNCPALENPEPLQVLTPPR